LAVIAETVVPVQLVELAAQAVKDLTVQTRETQQVHQIVTHQAETASVVMQQAVKVLTVHKMQEDQCARPMVLKAEIQQLLKMVIKPTQVAKDSIVRAAL
jgi:hypothetical protein